MESMDGDLLGAEDWMGLTWVAWVGESRFYPGAGSSPRFTCRYVETRRLHCSEYDGTDDIESGGHC